MRIMQVNSFEQTANQNKTTFTSKGSSVRELFQEASLLFEQEYGAMERALETPPKNVTEALMRYPYPPDELARLASRAKTPEALQAVFAPRLTGKFSDKLVAAYKTLAERAAEALIGGSKEKLDIEALKASDIFFSMNMARPTQDSIKLFCLSIARVGKVTSARPELDPIFSRIG